MYCNYCRALNPDDAIYCSSCGRTIQPPVEKENEPRETIREDNRLQDLNTVSASELRTDKTSSLANQRTSYENTEHLRASDQELDQPINDPLRTEPALGVSGLPEVATSDLEGIPQAVLTEQTDPSGIPPFTPLEPPAKHPPALAPYARFVVQILASCFFASIGVFGLFDATARNTTAFTLLFFSIVFTAILVWSARKTWNRVLMVEPKREQNARRRHRKAIVTIGAFVLLYLGLAALLGSVIGHNRAESIQFNVDVDHQKELADRISKARNSVSADIPSYLAMYAAIEPEIREYAATLSRLRAELSVYDSKFPDQHAGTQKLMASVEREIRRSQLLGQQIAVAKQIERLDESQRLVTWRQDMVPLLEAEDGLAAPK